MFFLVYRKLKSNSERTWRINSRICVIQNWLTNHVSCDSGGNRCHKGKRNFLHTINIYVPTSSTTINPELIDKFSFLLKRVIDQSKDSCYPNCRRFQCQRRNDKRPGHVLADQKEVSLLCAMIILIAGDNFNEKGGKRRDRYQCLGRSERSLVYFVQWTEVRAPAPTKQWVNWQLGFVSFSLPLQILWEKWMRWLNLKTGCK